MLFNKKVVVGEKGSPLKQSITLSNHIELQSNQNSFSFRIAAISYQSPSMNTLLYRLEGYDSNGIQRVRALLRIPIYLMGHTCYA